MARQPITDGQVVRLVRTRRDDLRWRLTHPAALAGALLILLTLGVIVATLIYAPSTTPKPDEATVVTGDVLLAEENLDRSLAEAGALLVQAKEALKPKQYKALDSVIERCTGVREDTSSTVTELDECQTSVLTESALVQVRLTRI